MDAVQPIVPFLGWIVLGGVLAIGAVGLHMLQNFLDDIREMNKRVNVHETTLGVHENRIKTLEGGE
jgi:hypothetical protein